MAALAVSLLTPRSEPWVGINETGQKVTCLIYQFPNGLFKMQFVNLQQFHAIIIDETQMGHNIAVYQKGYFTKHIEIHVEQVLRLYENVMASKRNKSGGSGA